MADPDSVFDALPEIGLEINAQKCRCLWPSTGREPPQSLFNLLRHHQINRLEQGSFEIMGAPVGCDDHWCRTWCSEQIRSHDDFFNALHHTSISSHHALLLVKTCLRPRLNFAMRCVPPSIFADSLADFDQRIVELIDSKILKHSHQPFRNASAFSSAQAQLPARFGGLGLTSAVVTSLAAFVASAALAIQDVHELILPAHLDPSSPHVPPMFNNILSSVRRLQQEFDVTTRRLPVSLDQLFEFWTNSPPQRLQHKIMENLQTHVQRRLLRSSSGSDKARLVAAAATAKSSAWLHMTANNPYSLSDQAVASAVCHRLGLQSVHILPSSPNCVCGKPLELTHFHACKLNIRCGVNDRHDKVKRCLARICERAGLDVMMEKSSWVVDDDKPNSKEGKLVPDLSISGLGQKVEVDISVICASSMTYGLTGCSGHFFTK